MADNDLLGTGVFSGKGVLEDGLVVFGLQSSERRRELEEEQGRSQRGSGPERKRGQNKKQ